MLVIIQKRHQEGSHGSVENYIQWSDCNFWYDNQGSTEKKNYKELQSLTQLLNWRSVYLTIVETIFLIPFFFSFFLSQLINTLFDAHSILFIICVRSYLPSSGLSTEKNLGREREGGGLISIYFVLICLFIFLSLSLSLSASNLCNR